MLEVDGSEMNGMTLRMGLIGCPEKFVTNYHYLLCNDPEERNSQVL
jgi:hypothetical protein